MDLRSIRLQHYRNYTDTSFDLGRHTVFVGPNGSGKTNVIEAIRTLSVTKSFRTVQDRDAITWDQPYCRVELTSENDLFEYILTRDEFGTKKVIKHNGTVVPFTQVYGLIPTVLFSPETMQLIDGSPQDRRRFLDTILSQADRAYLEALMTYRKVMRERHYVLLRLQQGLGAGDELDFWDSELTVRGQYIIQARRSFITAMNDLLTEIYPRFIAPESQEQLVLRYKPSCSAEDFPARLKSSRHYDIKTATTTVGPHRDDLVFLLRDRDVNVFASRGELRRSVIATKLAETRFLANASEREPVVLLDDVFSELDASRRASFLDAIGEYRTVITTTDLAFLGPEAIEGQVVHTLGQEK